MAATTAAMPEVVLREATVLGVWAHPDDEAYLSSGLMLRAVRGGGQVYSVHATLGELGTEDPEAWPPERLGPHRRAELQRALALVGVTEHQVLGLPDGGCADLPDSDVVPLIAAEIERCRPDLVLTFGPDGMTGHTDHRAVSRWTTLAWREVGLGRLLFAMTMRSHFDAHADLMARVGMEEDFPGVADDREATLVLSLATDELDVKREVLAAHGSQTEGLAAVAGEATYRDWVSVEAFREATPSDHAT